VLTHAEFGERFGEVSRRLWCIAAAVLGDPVRAEDIVQDAALTAMDRLDQFDPSTSFAAWMGQIVRYAALNARRAHGRERAASSAIGAEPAAPGAVGTPALDAEVLDALGVLDDTARECLVLKVVLGLTYEEIGEALSIPSGTAMSHVSRARRGVREGVLLRRERGGAS